MQLHMQIHQFTESKWKAWLESSFLQRQTTAQKLGQDSNLPGTNGICPFCSDEDLRLEEPLSDSEFGDDTDSEGEDDLESHLPLLVPEELQDLGVSALSAGNYEAAIRYLSLCQLRASENMGKQLSGGGNVEVGPVRALLALSPSISWLSSAV